MSKLDFVYLPLKELPSYSYDVPLGEETYTLEFNYNTYIKTWTYDIYRSDGEAVVLGRRLSPLTPVTERYDRGFEGVLYLTPIGKWQKETVSNHYEIWKYFNLLYVFPKGGEDGKPITER